MPWANFDDGFPDHPKVVKLSDGAFRLHVAGICHCNRYLTDGIVTADQVQRLIPRFRRSYITELTGRGLWLDVGSGDYSIYNFLEWNRSRQQVEQDRERKRKAGRKGAESRWHK